MTLQPVSDSIDVSLPPFRDIHSSHRKLVDIICPQRHSVPVEPHLVHSGPLAWSSSDKTQQKFLYCKQCQPASPQSIFWIFNSPGVPPPLHTGFEYNGERRRILSPPKRVVVGRIDSGSNQNQHSAINELAEKAISDAITESFHSFHHMYLITVRPCSHPWSRTSLIGLASVSGQLCLILFVMGCILFVPANYALVKFETVVLLLLLPFWFRTSFSIDSISERIGESLMITTEHFNRYTCTASLLDLMVALDLGPIHLGVCYGLFFLWSQVAVAITATRLICFEA